MNTLWTRAAMAICGVALLVGATGYARVGLDPAGPHYDPAGRLIMPTDYREWVFLSAGLDMNYRETAAPPDEHVFGNVFAPLKAYHAFQRTGVWPDKTILIVENRVGSTKGSINRSGQFQAQVLGVEAHVKDVRRFKGGWGFFVFDGDRPAALLPASASCYACHLKHAAADTTFVQFYPTLLPTATRLRTLSKSYLAETATVPQ